MNSTLHPWLLKHHAILWASLGFAFLIIFSTVTLTTKPRLWIDEAVSIDIARNFQTEHVLDVKTAPETFSGFRERLQSTGYPVTVPLSYFFKLFGYGLTQARTYMLLWMVGVLFVLLWLGRKWFGERNGVVSFLLVVTFASFYANGRTVVGEIPGLLFLLLGLYFLFSRERPFWAGLFFGFAVVSKLSVFGLLIPVFVVVYLFEWRRFFKVLVPLAVGMLPAGLTWILLNLDNPFLSSTWSNLIHFYQNPYSSSIATNVVTNVLAIPHSTTFMYFGALFAVVVVARFLDGATWKSFYTFVIVYTLFAFVYYLRSPGWLRYMLIAELLILFVTPHALSAVLHRFKSKLPSIVSFQSVAVIIFSALIVIQGSQLFLASDLYSGDGAIQASRHINEQFPDSSVGVLNALEVGILLNTSSRYLAMDLTGVPQVGENPLFVTEPPQVIVSHPGQRFLVEGQKVIDERYNIAETVGGYTLYERVR
ncbi:MAG: glycosyltransferase family 39 protein [Candidatus Taylorbacteria bacterium]|nr:glycosyltransferase family 39 protein [Candidatus Taylorbacteria bacterium]